MKPIKSTDFRKPAIVAALKKKALGGSKVTSVVEVRYGVFEGTVFAHDRDRHAWVKIGTYQVTAEEAGLGQDIRERARANLTLANGLSKDEQLAGFMAVFHPEKGLK